MDELLAKTSRGDGWTGRDLSIPVPLPNQKRVFYDVPNYFCRSICNKIISSSSSAKAKTMAFEPVEVRFRPPGLLKAMGVYGDPDWTSTWRRYYKETHEIQVTHYRELLLLYNFGLTVWRQRILAQHIFGLYICNLVTNLKSSDEIQVRKVSRL